MSSNNKRDRKRTIFPNSNHHTNRSLMVGSTAKKKAGLFYLVGIASFCTMSIIGMVVAFTPMGPLADSGSSSKRIDLESHDGKPQNALSSSSDVSAMGTKSYSPWKQPNVAESIQLDALKPELLEFANRLKESFRTNADALDIAADVYFNLNKYEEAELAWNLCLEQQPVKPEFFLNFVNYLVGVNKMETAVAVLERAHEKGMKSRSTLDGLAKLYEIEGDIENALRCISDSLGQSPDFADTQFLAGRLYSKNGDFEKAEVHLRRALELGGNEEVILSTLAPVLARLGKREEASKLNRRFQELKSAVNQRTPENKPIHEKNHESWRPAVHQWYLRAARLEKNVSDQIRLLQRCVQLVPHDQYSLVSLTRLFVEQKQWNNAIEACNALVASHPEISANFIDYAILALQLKDTRRAEEVLRQGVIHHPEEEILSVALAQLLLEQRRFQEATSIAQTWVNKSRNPQFFMILGTAYHATGRSIEANQWFQRAREMQAGPPMVSRPESKGAK